MINFKETSKASIEIKQHQKQKKKIVDKFSNFRKNIQNCKILTRKKIKDFHKNFNNYPQIISDENKKNRLINSLFLNKIFKADIELWAKKTTNFYKIFKRKLL